MDVKVNREELQAVAAGVVPETMRQAAANLVAELEQWTVLGDLFPIGLADGQSDDTIRRFAQWEKSASRVYGSEQAAREDRPGTFREVCTEWGRAGHIHRTYRLADGRTVVKQGCWWDVPEPGGSDCVYYFAS